MQLNTQLLIISQIIFLSQAWTLHKLTQYPEAKCLDGSSPGYYFRQGTSKQNENNFIIKFYSFGYCGHESMNQDFLQNCYSRIYSDRGSSQYLNPYPYDISGIFSFNENINPQYYDWNMIVFHSCDGTLMQGYNKDPIMFKNTQLWFRGYNNTVAYIKEVIKQYKLENANQVVIQGCSAGGLAAAQWLNYFRDQLPLKVQMYAVLDAAFLFDVKNIITNTNLFRQYIITMMQFVNIDQDPVVNECSQDNPEEKWKCIILQYLQEYIKVPIFITQSINDFWQFQYILGQYCENAMSMYYECSVGCANKLIDCVEQFKLDYLKQLQNTVLTDPQQRQLWTTECMAHCVTIDDRFFANDYYALQGTDKLTIAQALAKWTQNLTLSLE